MPQVNNNSVIIDREYGKGMSPSDFFPSGSIRSLNIPITAVWDAEEMAAGDVSNGSVLAWTDLISGYRPSQSTVSAQPAYSPTGFNGRPAVLFDGVGDYLGLETVPFYSGTGQQFEVWLLAGQTRIATDIAVVRAFSFGGGTGATAFRVGSVNVGGNKRVADARVVQDAATDYLGNNLVRTVTTATTVAMTVGTGATTTATTATSIGTSRLRIGGSDNVVADSPWQGPISAIVVTPLLTSAQAALLSQYLRSRGGLP